MSDWGLGKKLNSQIADVPLNHLIWINDYKTYGEKSYVFKNKDILHELYESPIAANDQDVCPESLRYMDSTGNVGKFFGSIYEVANSGYNVEWNQLSTLEETFANNNAVNAICNSFLAVEAIKHYDTALITACANSVFVAKLIASDVGLDYNDYSGIDELTASTVAMEKVAASTSAIKTLAMSDPAKEAVLASSTALNALDNSPLSKTMSSSFTATGIGFVISYSVRANCSDNHYTNGGYIVTVDSVVAEHAAKASQSGSGISDASASGEHLFFNKKIGLEFSSASYAGVSTGSGSMKYILVE